MEDLLSSHIQWRYLLNTCGTDFPIKTNREMVQALTALQGRNSMETEVTREHKKVRWQYHYNVTDVITWTDVRKSPPPISVPMFQGNAYVVVSRAFVKHVMEDSEVQKFLEWEKDTYSPDEHLWATLQRIPSVPGSVPAHIKYDESDMNAIARVVKWGGLDGDADLNCMEDLLSSHIQWRYLLNTCGTDFPIKTNREMVQALTALQGRNSMETEVTREHKKVRWQYHYNVTDVITWTDVRKSPPPISVPMFQGNAYVVVSRAFVKHVMEDSEVQKFLEWEKDTYSPDEHLWATLQRIPSVPGSVPAHIKYDESDMNAIARVVKWGGLDGDVRNGAAYDPCTGTFRRGVCVYGAGDLQWLLRQRQLFANKFDPEVDDVAIRCLESVLRFRSIFHGSENLVMT
ncbi:Beta-1,3-galactosyl-O-glycosyl-glycoprotein beta-1,6-N-acetylglucosaminyltransferase 3 [Larimichthys crocea]|uniref:Beta-1,3-galactosyl-O-glycosyl-glycoprotein beta-1,6-N-acetylglucosaminyltransferase 3 n=1 Tax=Larimichthys crocea TaxID=215358 RepID=A0A6G0IY91_LARCR|nr:Beta-1,3-galactosyl-O-glycosyl-glycoprotein beta-1,6-N-acetylglucosaminyltransferase 3 [Larimichthys crocea]